MGGGELTARSFWQVKTRLRHAGKRVAERRKRELDGFRSNRKLRASKGAEPMHEDIEKRIARVISDVRPTTAFPRRKTAACSLFQRMAHYATPGISIAVIDDGQVAWERGYGVRENGRPAPVEANTLFQAGSISKLVFALGAMRLVEEGRVTLDDDVQKFLTSWRVPANGDWTPKITLRQLLAHRAGTTVHGFPGYPATGPWPTLAQVLDGLPPANNLPVVVDLIPGLQFRYSGGGTTIAQLVVTDTLRQLLPEIMDERLFRPLNLANSTFEQPLPENFAARAATAHPWNGTPLPGGWHIYPETAAAGLWTTAGDLARVGAEFLRALQGRQTALGLSPKTAAEMLRSQLPDHKAGDDYVGLTWWCSGKDHAFHCYHEGWNEGFIAGLWLYPNAGKGAAVMINSNQGEELIGEVRKAIGHEYGWPEPTIDSTTHPLPASLAGVYQASGGISCTLSIFDECVVLRINNQSPLEFVREGSKFVSESVNAALEILLFADSRAALVLTQSDQKFRFEKRA
jgi:CubicO group peptidase (beta-lactamase class C family)